MSKNTILIWERLNALFLRTKNSRTCPTGHDQSPNPGVTARVTACRKEKIGNTEWYRFAIALFGICIPLLTCNAKQVAANHDGLRPSYGECLDAAAGVTPGMKQCMASEYTYQDARLNKAYKALIAALGNKDHQIKLRAEERVWITYRDSHCALEPDSGQAGELDAYECKVEETAKRAATLEDQLFQEQLKR